MHRFSVTGMTQEDLTETLKLRFRQTDTKVCVASFVDKKGLILLREAIGIVRIMPRPMDPFLLSWWTYKWIMSPESNSVRLLQEDSENKPVGIRGWRVFIDDRTKDIPGILCCVVPSYI